MSWILRRIERFRAAGLLTRTLVTTLALLISSSVVVAAMAFAALSATRAVFPPAADSGAPGGPPGSAGADGGERPEPLAARRPAGDGDAARVAKAPALAPTDPLAPATLRRKKPQARLGASNE